jgi:glycosyltransferase involved in cell wall biosynthesis
MRFLFVSDARIYGGHERVCLDIAQALSQYGEVIAAYSSENKIFQQELLASPFIVKTVRLNSRHKKAALYFASFRKQEQREMIALAEEFRPDLIFLCQGRIEACAPQMLALSRAKIPYISILPFAHAVKEIKPFGSLRGVEDYVRLKYYRLPSALIVPTAAASIQLRLRGVRAPVYVWPNIHSLIETIESSNKVKRIRCVGRIEFHQKRQDALVRLIAKRIDLFEMYNIEFVGDGPDIEKLARLIKRYNLSHFVHILGAVPREKVLTGVDAIIMPSRFEGLPLIMLEALSARIPFIGSKIDIFQSYLPDFAIDKFEDPVDLAHTIQQALHSANTRTWEALQTDVLGRHDPEKLRQEVRKFFASELPKIIWS